MAKLFQWNGSDFQYFFEQAPVALAISKIDGDLLLLCNNRLGQMFGVDPAELIGKPASSFYFDPNDRLLLLREFEERGAVERKHIEVESPDGKRFWIELTCHRFDVGGQDVIFSCIEDVTKHRQMQTALEKSEARFRTYFEFTPIPCCVWRWDGSCDFWLEACNSAAIEISKGPIPKKVGIKASHYFKARPDVLELFHQCMKEEGPVERELDFQFGKSGGEKSFSVHFMFVVPDTVMVYAIDRTKQRRMEQELDRKRAELSHKNRLATVGKMSSVLAHEISQPLGSIANFSTTATTLLDNSEVEIPHLHELLRDIVSEALRAGEITGSLKRFAGQAVPHRSTIDINDAAKEVQRLMAADARRHKATVSVRLSSESLMVNADLVQMQQVLVNLILNALESFEESSQATPEVCVETRRRGKNVEVLVSDNGPGIGPGEEEEVFKPYFSTKEAGLGLGLSIARELVESHGGRLWATPNKKSGLVMQMQLPVAGEPQS